MKSDETGLPSQFVERLKTIVPSAQCESVVESFSIAKKTVGRVNTIKSSLDEVLEQLNADRDLASSQAKPLPWCDHALVVEAEDRELLTRSQAASDGRLYVQGPSSVLASLILDPHPDNGIWTWPPRLAERPRTLLR